MNFEDKYIENKYNEDKYIEDENNEIEVIDNYISINENNNKNMKIILKKSKDEINIKFSDYIFKNCKYLISNDNKKIIFNLQKIGNIHNILNNLYNIKKNIFKNLEYKIHRIKMLIVLDKFIFLMLNKGFFCDFVNYNYVLYELKDNINININQNNDSNCDSSNCDSSNCDSSSSDEEIYFIKMKYITNINENIIKNNTKTEGKTHILFILHNNNLIYNLY
jgi:hypothetical protein